MYITVARKSYAFQFKWVSRPSFGSFLEWVKRFVTNFREIRSVPHAGLTAANLGPS